MRLGNVHPGAAMSMVPKREGGSPGVSQSINGRRSAIDGRTTRNPGYAVSQRICNASKKPSVGQNGEGAAQKMRHRGLPEVGSQFTLAMADSNLARLPKSIGALVQ